LPDRPAQFDDPSKSRRGGAIGTARAGDAVDASKLIESLAEIERQVNAFKAQSVALEQDEGAFAGLCIELVRTRESRDSWEQSWEQAQADVENSATVLQSAKGSLVERAKQIETLQAQLDSTNAILEATKEQLVIACADRNSARSERDQAKALLEEAQAKLTAITGEIDDLRAQAEQATRAHDEAQARLGNVQSEIDSALAERDNAQRLLDEKQARLESTEAELGASRSEIEAAQREHEQSRSERDAARGEREAARTERDDARRERDTAHQDRDAARNELERTQLRLESLQSELGSAHNESASTKTEYESVHGEIDSLRTQLSSARHERDDALSALESAQAQLGEAQASLEATDSSGTATEAQLESFRSERDEARTKVQELNSALASAREELDAAQSLIEEAASVPTPAPPADRASQEFVRRRRDRLGKYRELVERQAAKVIQAEALLAERIARMDTSASDESKLQPQLDALASERDGLKVKLGQAAKAIRQLKASPAPAKLVVKKAPSRTLGSIAFVLLGVAALSATSWHFSGEFAHASYVAEMGIAPEIPASEMAEGESEAWLSYHESLTTDAQVLGLAAERLKRRGITSLADPIALREKIELDLDVMRTGEGGLGYTMRGTGGSATRRALETYVLTLVSFANDTRDYRKDGASTLVSVGAKAGDEPISSNRLELFGIIAGASLIVCAVLGFMFARLSRPSTVPKAFAATNDELVIP